MEMHRLNRNRDSGRCNKYRRQCFCRLFRINRGHNSGNRDKHRRDCIWKLRKPHHLRYCRLLCRNLCKREQHPVQGDRSSRAGNCLRRSERRQCSQPERRCPPPQIDRGRLERHPINLQADSPICPPLFWSGKAAGQIPGFCISRRISRGKFRFSHRFRLTFV